MYWVLSCIEPTPKVRQSLVPAHFALIITIVVHVVSVINMYMQKAEEPDNDAGFLKVIIAAVHVYSQLNYNYSYPSKPRVVVTVFRLH